MRFIAIISQDRQLIARGSVMDKPGVPAAALAEDAINWLRRDGERNNSFLDARATPQDAARAADFDRLVARFGEAIVEAMETSESRIETAFARDGRVDVRPGDFVMLGIADAPMSCRIEILDDAAIERLDRQLEDILG